jgi:outer membrane protein OmpA-like peptidoglycan-associated protein
MGTHLNRFLVAAAFAALTGCTTGTSGGGTAGGAAASAERGPSDFEDVALNLAELGPGFVRNGMFVPVQELTQVRVGMSRDEVRTLLGDPIADSSAGWWFYNINLPLEGIDDYLVCQYRVAFTGESVSEAAWRRPQCKARYDELVAGLAPTPAEPQTITLSSDVLFAYKSDQLSGEGRSALDDVARVVMQEVELRRIDVAGHADRIGSDTYNFALSERRARAVGAYLAQRGIPSGMIFIEGRGETSPVVTCPGDAVTDALKACLQPNRRVEITINGSR